MILFQKSKTFTQSIYLVERICGICSTSHPIACVHAIEDVNNTEIPLRARYIRTFIGELERIHSHLLWLGLAGHFIGYDTLWMWAWKYREPVLQMFEIISGNRNHYGMMRVGGVAKDIDPSKVSSLLDIMDEIEKKIEMIAKAANDDQHLPRTVAVDWLPIRQGFSTLDLSRDQAFVTNFNQPGDPDGVLVRPRFRPSHWSYEEFYIRRRICRIVKPRGHATSLESLRTVPVSLVTDYRTLPAGYSPEIAAAWRKFYAKVETTMKGDQT